MKNNDTLARVNIRLHKPDLEYLKKNYPDNYNGQLRRIVAKWVARNRNRTEIPE